MALEGSLEEVGLADILQLLALGQKTGCLSVTDGSNFGYIYFDDGKIIYASVLNRPDRLGELLVRNDVVTRDELARGMKEQGHRPGERLGEILVEEGFLSEDELHEWIRVQIEEAVYHLFTWNEGTFYFEPDREPEQSGLYLARINADALLMEGARRVDEMSLIEKKIPSRDLVFALEREPEGEDVDLTEAEGKVLPLVDGQRTVDEIVRASGLVEFEAMKALFGLIQAGFAVQTGRRDREDEKADESELQQHLKLADAFYRSGMMEDAAREYEEALGADPSCGRARARLGVIALRSGRFDEALEHYDALSEEDADAATIRNRALALEMLGRYEEAVDCLARLDGTGDGPEILLQRGVVQLKSGRSDAARSTLERYRKGTGRRPLPAIYYAYAVLAAALSGDLDAAVTLGREGLEHHPEHGAILVNTGAVLEAKGEPDAAEAVFLRAVSSDSPTPAQAHKNLGDRAWTRGDAAGARAHYERAVKIAPRLGDDVYRRLGEIALREDDPDLALLLWQRALELNPENDDVRAGLESLESAPGG